MELWIGRHSICDIKETKFYFCKGLFAPVFRPSLTPLLPNKKRTENSNEVKVHGAIPYISINLCVLKISSFIAFAFNSI